MGAGLIFISVREVHSFLAITDPVHGGALIAEGWLPDHAFDEVAAEFKRNQYDTLYVTGGPIEQRESCTSYITYAERGEAIVRSKGLAPSVVRVIPALKVHRDRTYASAVALRKWLVDHEVTHRSYHVMSFGPHTRRTRLLFEQALGEGAIVGSTAIEDPDYDPKHWWNTSVGVRTVIDEAIAYGYARFLFRQTE